MNVTAPEHRSPPWWIAPLAALVLAGGLLASPGALHAQDDQVCETTVWADVVALDQVFFWNRLGAFQPHGMMFALRRDVVPKSGYTDLSPGNVQIRQDKRPRPLTLRVNVGDCLRIEFQNLLAASPVDNEQPATREAGVHVVGMQLVDGIGDDGSNVGRNATSLAAPGGTATYTLYAEREGTFLLYSNGAVTGGEGNQGQMAMGLFGAVNVEPAGSEWYRSQVTRTELDAAQVQDPVYDEYGAVVGYEGRTTPGGQPILDYDAVYPSDHEFAGLPILRMTTAGGEIVHSDLTAVVTGPARGPIGGSQNTDAEACASSGTYALNKNVLRNRCEPFREFTIIFHDEPGAVQAFPAFEDPVLRHTLHSTRDAFAINYGTGGIGAEILANRLGLGPMWNCNECKYEEFFLTSWAVGDPAMVVDLPANATPDAGPKATAALYPDDPANTYHSYISDHVKFRNLHAGKEHHVFHLHAHQWLFTPDSDESQYLDSQAIGPGASYTYEIAYDGSGNRNKTPGDAIFHCHFYPHFAQGMWALWRNHDTFEPGTPMTSVLNANGVPVDVPASGPAHETRATPDGEILAGIPTPALVPLPGKSMPPMPSAEFPGYPFYIPGAAGHRPPTPALDIARDDVTGELLDGGIPRHVVVDGGIELVDGHPVKQGHDLESFSVVPDGFELIMTTGGGETHYPTPNRLDMGKDNFELNALVLPEEGTPLERNAMAVHSVRQLGSWAQPTDGSDAPPADYIFNGLPAIAGAPFADPCVDDWGDPIGLTAAGEPLRRYKGAGFQVDAKYTKAGWHFPQHRMLGLNEDVSAFLAETKPPEPFYFRANSNDCIEFLHTNLLPHIYELDDFQVKTPTDVLGQHIHLVKFDVTSSDGSANGYNYEDGTFAPGEVIERIEAANRLGGLLVAQEDGTLGRTGELHPRQHPAFPGELGLGARTTVQRWWADPVLSNDGVDRTLGTVYTHDHYAPSTQQQAGFYAGLLIEPEGSLWRHSETGELMYTRDDGGPTSWQAIIETVDPADSYREFMLSQADFGLAYTADSEFERTITDEVTGVVVTNALVDRAASINPPAKKEIGLPFLLQKAPLCPGGVQPPCPEGISADDPGFYSINYRGEPLGERVRNPATNAQAAGLAGDLSHAFRSDVTRADPDFNRQPDFYPPLTAGLEPGDPFTPLLRAYENDPVKIRVLVGAQEEGHNWLTQGVKWLLEPSWENSGYKNAQMMGISEHFEFEIPAFQSVKGAIDHEDYLNMPGSSVDDLWGGAWNLLRAYDGSAGIRSDLATVPSNPDGKAPTNANPRDFQGVCPLVPGKGKPQPLYGERNFNIVAGLARDLLPEGTLVYNPREGQGGRLHDPTAILFVHEKDIDKKSGRLRADVPVEPLVLRANAGDCISVTLDNRLATDMPDLDGFSTAPMLREFYNLNQVHPSSHVGLNVQLLAYDQSKSDGTNVGLNPVQTAAPGEFVKYQWFAGDIAVCQGVEDSGPCAGKEEGTPAPTPVEFGAVPLISSDRIQHQAKGGIGALVIEPLGASWTTDDQLRTCGQEGQPRCSRAAATVTLADGSEIREMVLQFQDDLNFRRGEGDGEAVENLAEAEDPEDSGQKGINYRTEPMWKRLGFEPDTPLGTTRTFNFSEALSNAQVGGEDPVTPLLQAEVGTPVRFRVVQSAGHARNHVFAMHGHIWEQIPWTEGSTVLGYNGLSEWKGSQEGIGAGSAFNFLLRNGAGGRAGVTGDYLYRDFSTFLFDGGMWGILRVTPADK